MVRSSFDVHETEKMTSIKEDEEAFEVNDFTPVQQFYHGKNIFITGVTGYVGKFLLEKLLRCCPGIGMIYVLMRTKKGLSVDERLDKMFKLALFDKVRMKNPDPKSKLRIVVGDMESLGFGLSEEDAEILRTNVHLVFHSAANVAWDDPLKKAVYLNVLSLRNLMDFVKTFTNLKVFLHVSTSYVYREPDFSVPEQVAKVKISPKQLLDTLEWLDEDAVNAISPCLLRENFNTYLFSKALAENVVAEQLGSVPFATAIVRPCNISPALKDPIPGWCDTLQGIQGLFLAAAKGFLRALYSYPGFKLNIIPIDTVVNTLITTAWHVGKERLEDVFVVNCVLDYEDLPLGNEDLLQEVLKKRDVYPLVNIYRYPDFSLYYNKFLYHVHVFFDHYIPAVIGDTLLFVFTGKTIMLRMYRKIDVVYGVILSVAKLPWICRKENYNKVMNSLSPKDSELFQMNLKGLDWSEYIDDMLASGRRTLCREPDTNLPYAKKKAKVWLTVTTILKWIIILYFLNYMVSIFFPDHRIASYIGLESV